jgi:hypothetical protein
VAAGGGIFDFFRRDGRPIPASPALRRAAGLQIISGEPRSLGAGEPYDLGLTVDALLGRKQPQRVELGVYGQGCLAA